ncbi:hypothetical protein PT974_12247 [Cladobotryum mycophilum]|uniref:Uncharacterized protein n=1 Tax=Cladobotryum mycophilum TaxID=491253 RepID=A0ABR0S7F2_9HYPO
MTESWKDLISSPLRFVFAFGASPHDTSPSGRPTGLFLDPVRDVLDFTINEPESSSSERFDAGALADIVSQCRARHVRLQPEFWKHAAFPGVVETIMAATSVKTLTPYQHHTPVDNCNLMFRIVRDSNLPEHPVVWAIDEEDAEVRNDNRFWGFSPVSETLVQHGAVNFNIREQFDVLGLTTFLVVDDGSFPDEFIWGFAATRINSWGDITQLPSGEDIDSWKASLFTHIDGVCFQDFGFDGAQPPPGWDTDWGIDLTTDTIALATWVLLNHGVPVVGLEHLFPWFASLQIGWIDAILWGKSIECNGLQVDELRPLDRLGEAEREVIETILRQHTAGVELD